jgi:hypothetical protein
MGAFLFASMAAILLMLLWRQIVQNYLKKVPYFFFLIGGAALYAASLMPIVLVENRFHIIAQFSALAFVIFGAMMLLQAREKLSIMPLIISSFAFAIAIACRPSALFWSILIPVLLWDKKKEILNVKGLLSIIIPFTIVGLILAWYNYARFDSPFDFGAGTMIAQVNQTVPNQLSIIGKIHSLIKISLFTLFNPPDLNVTFPFVAAKISNFALANSLFMNEEMTIGIFCFPVMWFLFYIGKINILKSFIFAGIIISLLNIATLTFIGGIAWRYAMDFAWVLAISSFLCVYQLQEREQAIKRTALKIFYLCCIATLLLVFFSTISYRLQFNHITLLDPKISQYLARTFGVICNTP